MEVQLYQLTGGLTKRKEKQSMQAAKVKQRGERPDMPETASWFCESGRHRAPSPRRTSPILNDTPSSHSSLRLLFILSFLQLTWQRYSSASDRRHLFFFPPLSDSASVFFPLTRGFVVKMQYSFVFTIRWAGSKGCRNEDLIQAE